jgi:glycosyltransferase involved in cell wall biosynthesis
VYRGWQVGVVIPARDEAAHISDVLRGLPRFVDYCIVIDDGSIDETKLLAESAFVAVSFKGRVIQTMGRGVGSAIDAGHQALCNHFDDVENWLAVVVAGDGQMDPDDLELLLDPIVEDNADYVKGNRADHADGFGKMPLRRKIGTALLSFWTTLACGRRFGDPQCGFTATSGTVLQAWDWPRSWPGYGYPNYWLMRLTERQNVVVEVPVRAIYSGQKSGLRISSFIFRVAPSLLAGLHRRGWKWYVIGEIQTRWRLTLLILWVAGFFSLLSWQTLLFSPFFWAAAHFVDRRVVEQCVYSRRVSVSPPSLSAESVVR